MIDSVTKPKTKVKTKTERPRLHKVILINDDYTPREFVVTILKGEFRMNEEEAYKVMITAHRQDDRGASGGEFRPRAAADVAVKNVAEVQRDAETETLDLVANGIAHGLDTGTRLARSFQHARADLLGVADILIHRKHGEQSV